MPIEKTAGSGLVPLIWTQRAIVVADVVESVRLVHEFGAEFIARWRSLVADVRRAIDAQPEARIVKSLGDGLMIEATSARSALAMGFALQRAADRASAGAVAEARLSLRVGIDLGVVAADEFDVYGDAANLAARLAERAAPGEVVVSEALASAAVDGLDAWLEDLGPVYLKHVAEPLHAYRARPPVERRPVAAAVPSTAAAPGDLRPLVAMMPLQVEAADASARVPAELLTDSIVFRLARSDQLRVCSQLTMRAFEGRDIALSDVARRVRANFVLSGSLKQAHGRAVVSLELADAQRGDVLWADRLHCRPEELLSAEEPHGAHVAAGVAKAIGEHALRRARVVPPPSLDAYALQLGAITMMHRPVPADFARSRELLEQLIERHPRAPSPRAWLAKWFVLRATRGLAAADDMRAGLALDHARRAVDLHADSAFAHAMEAFVRCHLVRDLDSAATAVERAIGASASEPLAWLVRCVVLGFRGDGDAAWDAAQHALSLSPFDPIRHYFESLAASAAVAARRLDDAVELAQRSLHGNRDHLPTLRVLAVSLAESGREPEAHAAVSRLLEVDAGFTVAKYLASGPPGSEGTRQRYAKALRAAGAPAG